MLYGIVQHTYNNSIRERLPKTWAVYAGVTVRNGRLLDLKAHDPEYKYGLLRAIHDNVEGRTVELVGLGRGVSTVHALWAGAESVTAYEASNEMIDQAMETFDVNHCDTSTIDVRHALVGDAVAVYGPYDDAEQISPRDLGRKDVLVLDVEGAEIGILESLGGDPPVAIVETHPERGATTDAVVELLEPNYPTVETIEHKSGADPRKRIVVASK